ncbi:dihydrofolate reductase [Bacillaceae bacterium IKA-2]|nr:dihydrofolate reductase [Bacillaceae bacterium IKA-2]
MISLIVAMAENNVIGFENKMPWHLPADLAHFKKTTTGHTIVMGRKTFQSIGRPLPNRTNLILTRDLSFRAEGCLVIHDIKEVLEKAKKEDLFVIGGAEIYQQFLPYAEKIYSTQILESFHGDTFFPQLTEEWKMVATEKYEKDKKNHYKYEFQVYKKI